MLAEQRGDQHAGFVSVTRPGLDVRRALIAGQFGVDDGEVHGIADAPGCGEHVLAERAFFDRAEARERRARPTLSAWVLNSTRIAPSVSNAWASSGSLVSVLAAVRWCERRVPRPADLEPVIGRRDVAVARAADDLVGRRVERSRTGATMPRRCSSSAVSTYARMSAAVVKAERPQRGARDRGRRARGPRGGRAPAVAAGRAFPAARPAGRVIML